MGTPNKNRWNYFVLIAFFTLGGIGSFKPSTCLAEYKLTIHLDRFDYEALPQQHNQTEDDVKRTFTLFSNFRVDDQVNSKPLPGPWNAGDCYVKFLPDSQEPNNRDDWDNYVRVGWEGMVAPMPFIQFGPNNSAFSNNIAVLTKGGTFPCSLNQSAKEAGLPLSALDTSGKAVGGNMYTHRQPPLVSDEYLSWLRLPDGAKVHLIIYGEEVDMRWFQIQWDRDNKSHYHSSNFVIENTSGMWFWKQIIKASAKWPFE